MLKEKIEKYPEFLSLFLLVSIAALYLPTHVDGAMTIISIPLIYLFKDKIVIDRNLKLILLSFLLYLIFFTIFSQYILQSSVALARILRGMLFFAFAQLLVYFIFRTKRFIYHSIFLFIFVAASFFFKKPHIFGNGFFWGYHAHPNTQAFALCFFMILAALLFLQTCETASRVINGLTILVGLVLLYITNSRSVWFGMIVGGVVLLVFANRLSLRSKAIFSSLAVAGGGVLLFLVSKKPPGVTGRDSLWNILIEQTKANHPFFGYGLNTNKLILQKFDLGINMSHNSLIEVYSSTGIIGLIAFLVICFFVFLCIYKKKAESDSSIYRFGLYGFSTFLAISLFDIKLFDYTFMATIFIFLGFIYLKPSINFYGRDNLSVNKKISRKIFLFVSTFADGGIEKVYINLCREFCERGLEVHLIIGRLSCSTMIDQIDVRTKIVNLKSSNPYFCQPRLISYLFKERPRWLITDRYQSLKAAILAKKILRGEFEIYGTLHGHLSAMFELEGRDIRWQRKLLKKIEWCLPAAAGIIAVSHGVANDFLKFFPQAAGKLQTIYNPVVTTDFAEKAQETLDHSWLSVAEIPVILGAGRLSVEKDFNTLIRAFAEVHKKRRCRLIIIGGGEEGKGLQDLAKQLGVSDDVALLGFQNNPLAWMAHADLFALSSKTEGLGNVLIEAIATGTPVVSTDCPSGPREILQDGKYGVLVPVGDVGALAAAMDATLDHPVAPELLSNRGLFFSSKNSADSYLRLLNFEINP